MDADVRSHWRLAGWAWLVLAVVAALFLIGVAMHGRVEPETMQSLGGLVLVLAYGSSRSFRGLCPDCGRVEVYQLGERWRCSGCKADLDEAARPFEIRSRWRPEGGWIVLPIGVVGLVMFFGGVTALIEAGPKPGLGVALLMVAMGVGLTSMILRWVRVDRGRCRYCRATRELLASAFGWQCMTCFAELGAAIETDPLHMPETDDVVG